MNKSQQGGFESPNKKQRELLEKEFKVNEDFSITRSDYEAMPCPMLSFNWSDARMEELAKTIAAGLEGYNYDETSPYLRDEKEDDFWREMENCAVRLGMEYYEDFSDEHMAQLDKEWESIK
jgi:hypothetical protein